MGKTELKRKLGYFYNFSKLILSSTILFVLMGLIFVVDIPAGTIGNPISTDTPNQGGIFSLKKDRNVTIKGGLEVEILFDRDISADASSNMVITSAEWYMSKVSWSFRNRVEPYIKFGLAHFKTEWTEAGQKAKLESDTKFAWGVGLKALVLNLEAPHIKLIADGFYRMADVDAESGSYGGSTVTLDSNKSRFLIRDWHIALAGATEIDISGSARGEFLGISSLVPYIGIKYSDLNGRIRQTISDALYHNPGKIEAADNIGFFVGCDFVGPNSVVLNIEGRFLDEEAVTVGLSALF